MNKNPALIEAKINLYKILDSMDKNDLSDTESNLLFEMSFDPDLEESVKMPIDEN